jgi:ribonuclease HI
MKQVSMYVNGHTLKTNPGHAGSGVVLSSDSHTKEAYKAIGHGTNNQAELEAVIYGIGFLNQPCDITVYSCSQWLVNCGSGKWDKSKYLELWEQIDPELTVHTIRFEWIKKGSHNLLDRASALANEGANESAVSE